MKYIKEAYYLFPMVLISFLLVFTRPFVGLGILGFRLGELMVVFGFVVVMFSPFYYIFFHKKYTLKDFQNIQVVFTMILISFFLSVLINNTEVFVSYTYKISSYIWTVGFLIFSFYFLKDNSIVERYNKIVIFVFLLLPILHYFFSTGYYPNFVIDFFIRNSDKFEFTKAHDIMLSLLVANLLNLKFIKNNSINVYYLYISFALLLPLLLFMSRGAFISGFLFLFIFSIYNFNFFIKNLKILFKAGLSFFIVFTLSTYNVNGSEINYNFDQIGKYPQLVGELSVTENIKQIAKKDQQRKAFLSLYYEDGRIYSHDPTTDWRLDIWQDVFEDLENKSLLLKGYGYNEIIPVMLDPSAPGRLGRDGLNEHVHNYFVNIFARGGFFQFLLFLIFYFFIVVFWKKKFNNYTILIYLVPVLLNSTLDMSMEGVQYPVVFYLFLGYIMNSGFQVKLIK